MAISSINGLAVNTSPAVEFIRPARRVRTLEEDVKRGLMQRPRWLPAKYLYDERGSTLFDLICETPEYYPTRTENALLKESAPAILARVRPTDILEIGSGMSRKTHRLLDACEQSDVRPSYTAFDISEDALLAAGERLDATYQWLDVRLLHGDYEAGFANIPRHAPPRMFVFLGSTIGNFEHDEAVALLRDLRDSMTGNDWLLLGADRVKNEAVLNAAYNDSLGLTADFNLNVLRILNRVLDANFDLDQFAHQAYYEPAKERIEMHLVAQSQQQVEIGTLDKAIEFNQHESLCTEISRKFTNETLDALLQESGFLVHDHFAPDNEYFSLVLATPDGPLSDTARQSTN